MCTLGTCLVFVFCSGLAYLVIVINFFVELPFSFIHTPFHSGEVEAIIQGRSQNICGLGWSLIQIVTMPPIPSDISQIILLMLLIAI